MARYYPNGSNRPKNKDDHQLFDNSATLEDNGISEWLYADDWNQAKLEEFERRYAIPGFRQYLDYLLDRRADSEYLNRYGMDYSDIHDPRKLRETNSAAHLYGSVYNFVSDNVKRLYR